MSDPSVSPADTPTQTEAMRMRGTPADAPNVRRLLDEVSVRVPPDSFGYSLWAWAEEVTRLVEGL